MNFPIQWEKQHMSEEKIDVTETRKNDHIDLAFKSQVMETDSRFYYEPVLNSHPSGPFPEIHFLNKKMKSPIWISSMTGGTQKAHTINRLLAKSCKEFGLGMGLGSCRIILEDNTYFEDFNLRPIMGDDAPFFANLGIAQLESLIARKKLFLVSDLIEKLQADGLIIHVNPMQEWLQPEGDRFSLTPKQVIEEILTHFEFDIIVKEVGQGMGYESLKALFQLPLAAIDFGAHGGTNFSKLELLRSSELNQKWFEPLTKIGHTAEEMVQFTNSILQELGDKIRCNQIIISGGIQNFLDGYYLINKVNAKAVYGQASPFLKHASESYESLQKYISAQIDGLRIANAMLTVR